jgi:predicted nucleic acid-binding protein
VTFLVDTSALVHLLRDRSGTLAPKYDRIVAGRPTVLCRITEFELLNGARDEREWAMLVGMLREQSIIDIAPAAWAAAGQIVFDLKRRGTTLASVFDCIIAQTALDHNLDLIHDDRDFEAIAKVRPLRAVRFKQTAKE